MLKTIRADRILGSVQERYATYQRQLSQEERLSEQLRRFNGYWPLIRFNVPYYRDLAAAQKLPDSFISWHQVIDSFPVMDRATIQEHRDRLADTSKPPQWFRITGGSTAQPIQLPAWKSENQSTSPDIWLGRSWYGIRPADRLFMIWGHSHLLGTGWRGRYNRKFNCTMMIVTTRNKSAHLEGKNRRACGPTGSVVGTRK
jgi:phenylacetate-coenzyme A ligase PaaK-like adenylate-forming protein